MTTKIEKSIQELIQLKKDILINESDNKFELIDFFGYMLTVAQFVPAEEKGKITLNLSKATISITNAKLLAEWILKNLEESK